MSVGYPVMIDRPSRSMTTRTSTPCRWPVTTVRPSAPTLRAEAGPFATSLIVSMILLSD